MKRRDVLGLLLLGGPLAKTVGAYQQPGSTAGRGGQPQGPPTVEVEKLRTRSCCCAAAAGRRPCCCAATA